jgi:multidrug resistance efflux pump
MARDIAKAVQIKPVLVAPTRHPIKAASLLYNAPSYVLRGPIYLVFVILLMGIIYAFIAKQDQIVMAPLALEKDSVTIEAVGGGLVFSTEARENSLVNYGDPLVTVQEQLSVSRTPEQDRLESELFDLRDKAENAKDEYEHQEQQLKLKADNLNTGDVTGLQAAKNRISQLAVQLTSARRARDRQAERLKLAQENLRRNEPLYQQRDITITQYQQIKEAVNEAQKALDDAEARIHETDIALQTAKADQKKLEQLNNADQIKNELYQLKDRYTREQARLNKRIKELEDKLRAGVLVECVEYAGKDAKYTSCYDGLITKVHIKKGEIVSPGAPLVTLIKNTSVLEGHAFVENKDIGHLKRGQEVKIKYFAYPYQEYGIHEGEIVEIATTPSGLPGKESKYQLTIALRDHTIRKGGKAKTGKEGKPLDVGLEGIAEIKTGAKRFIEILFSPISTFFAGEEES